MSGRTDVPDEPNRKWTAAHVLAGLAGIIAILALVGWVLEVPALTSLVPGQPTMKLNTALAVGLLSASRFAPQRVALFLVAVAGGIAVVSLLEHLGVGVDIDNLVVADTQAQPHPGRMSVVTGCCLLLLSFSLGMLTARRRFLVQLAATVALALAGLVLLAFVFDVPLVFVEGPFATLAVQTAVAFGMLSVAALLGVPGGSLSWMLHGRDAGAKILRILLGWTLVALPFFGYLRLLGQRAGWYETNFGTTLMVGAAFVVLTIAAWVGARALSTVDIRRAATLIDLEVLTADLDSRVRARTAELEQERESLLAAEAVARAAQAASERANTAKDRFMSRMSHELRTPLNAVLGFGQLLEMEELTAAQAESVGHILGGGRHLLAMIDDLLDISGIVSDSPDFHIAAVPVCAIVQETIGLMSPAAGAGRVEIHFDRRQADFDYYLLADQRRFRQVLLNLLSNAIKYNTAGGRVLIGIQPGVDGFVSITVADDGLGIAAENLPRLFDPFDRLGQEATEIEGTGIGLALSQRLVIGMGGQIYAESTVGLGSTFTVTMPTTRINQPAPFPGKDFSQISG
ncbi:MAG: ATP-binding protein [Nakamurella sp.]